MSEETQKKTKKKVTFIFLYGVTKDGKVFEESFDSKVEAREYLSEFTNGVSGKNGHIKLKEGGWCCLVTGRKMVLAEKRQINLL